MERTKVGYTAEKNTTQIDSNETDSKGRVIGKVVVTWEADVIPAPKTAVCYMTLGRGYYYVANVQATRDGSPFGASQRDKYFATRDERDAYVTKRISK